MVKQNVRQLTTAAMIAGLYVVIGTIFAPVSFGPIQFRISEALTILAVFSPFMAGAVTVGCGIFNLIGFMLGLNPLLMDVVFGTFATGVAALMTWRLGHIRFKGYPILAVLPPILINAIIIGGEITWLMTNSVFGNIKVLLLNSAYIGVSQIIPCAVAGPILVTVLERTGIADRYLI